MNSAQRQLFVVGMLLTVVLAPYFNLALNSFPKHLWAVCSTWPFVADTFLFHEPPSDPDDLVASRPLVEPMDYINRVDVQLGKDQRFGIVCPRLRDCMDRGVPKRLTGSATNTCIRIDGDDFLFGQQSTGVRWVKDRGEELRGVPIPGKDQDRCWMSVCEMENGRIRVRQSVEIILGEQTRLYDTVLVRYRIWNRDWQRHTVGLRVLLDTRIGSNDDAPFHVPPSNNRPGHLVASLARYSQSDMPDFISALESANFKDKDLVVAVLGLRVRGAEPLERLIVCGRPANPDIGWQWDYSSIRQAGNSVRDACAVLYWQQGSMKPDEHRDLAFTYGLGRIASDVGGKMGCPNGGRMRLFCARASTRKPFPITLYIKAADPDQMVTLQVPEGMTLAEGQQAERRVPPPGEHGYGHVTWMVKASKAGQYSVKVEAPGIGRAEEPVRVIDPGVI